MAASKKSDWGKYPYEIEEWSPEKAQEAIDGTPKDKQRPTSDPRAESFGRDMEHGRWDVCFIPIVISDKGYVLNGLHRLWGVVLSGRTIFFPTYRKVEYRHIFHLDLDTQPRSVLQQGNLTKKADRRLTSVDTAIARAFIKTPYDSWRDVGKPSSYEVLESFNKHRESIEFARDAFGDARERGITTCSFKACVAVAHAYGLDPQFLLRMVEVFTTGAIEKGNVADENMVRLRQWAQKAAGNGHPVSGLSQYKRMARVLFACNEGEELSRIYEASTNPFPIYEDE